MNTKGTLNVECPHCGAEWELDQAESQKPEFTCETCNTAFSVQEAIIPEAVAEVSELPPTRLSEVVVVILRLLALSFGLDTFSFLLRTLGGLAAHTSSAMELFIVAIMALCTYWLWRLAPSIAGRVTRGQDSSVHCEPLELVDLYSFAFLLLGLYFAVDSLAPSLTWFHYTMTQSTSDSGLSPQQQKNFYTLFTYLVRLFLGLALVFNGRRFATRLIKHQNESIAPRSVASAESDPNP